MKRIIDYLDQANAFFLSYIAVVLIIGLGSYFSWKSRFFQFRCIPAIGRNLWKWSTQNQFHRGIHPLKVFFTSIGGMIGIGNIAAVTTAVQIGGPGALFWMWIVGILGSLIKYSEIYLGHKYRIQNSQGNYDGGPMYFLNKAWKTHFASLLVACLLCIYGTEVYQFSVIIDSITSNWPINRFLIIPLLISFILYAGLGGFLRVSKICVLVLPFFTTLYFLMCLWIIFHHFNELPHLFSLIIRSAFEGQAAKGGFLGSSLWLALQQGGARAAYSADLAIGYDSIIHSASSVIDSKKQAQLSILGVFIDNLVCTCSTLVVLITGLWKASPMIASSRIMQSAFELYFPYMHTFMPLLIFILGYTTIIAYFSVCLKCAKFMHQKNGVFIYLIYAICAYTIFSFYDQTYALMVMAFSQSFLMILNLFGIYQLRKEIEFKA